MASTSSTQGAGTPSDSPPPRTDSPAPVKRALARPDYERYGKGSRVGYEMFRTFLKGLVFPLGGLRVEGLENIPKDGPVILACNHVHWTDIPYISLRPWRITHYMAKVELFSVPVLGWIMTSLGTFPVRRGERDRDSLKLAEHLLRIGEVVTVFPEGHRSAEGVLQVGHPGVALMALHTEAPIVPVGISGTQRVLRRGWRYGPFRPTVTVRYGVPFRLRSTGKRVTREELTRGTEVIMGNIAALLPPEMRGHYANMVPHIAPIPGGEGIPSIEFPENEPMRVVPAEAQS